MHLSSLILKKQNKDSDNFLNQSPIKTQFVK